MIYTVIQVKQSKPAKVKVQIHQGHHLQRVMNEIA